MAALLHCIITGIENDRISRNLNVWNVKTAQTMLVKILAAKQKAHEEKQKYYRLKIEELNKLMVVSRHRCVMAELMEAADRHCFYSECGLDIHGDESAIVCGRNPQYKASWDEDFWSDKTKK